MDTSPHDLKALFAQLGLPDSDAAIAEFVDQHRPLDPALRLEDAPFWNGVQRRFIAAAIEEDAEWVEAVDHLDALLRH
jgi:hypothetical protein